MKCEMELGWKKWGNLCKLFGMNSCLKIRNPKTKTLCWTTAIAKAGKRQIDSEGIQKCQNPAKLDKLRRLWNSTLVLVRGKNASMTISWLSFPSGSENLFRPTWNGKAHLRVVSFR